MAPTVTRLARAASRIGTLERGVSDGTGAADTKEGANVGLPISGADYIKKLFQVPFTLPTVSPVQLDDHVAAIFSGARRAQALSWLSVHGGRRTG